MLKRLFGSYSPWFEALCEADPAFPAFIMTSDRSTRHFICAVLTYSKVPLDEAMNPALATDLRLAPRAKVLTKHIGEHVPGLSKAIGKLTGKPWSHEQYQSLHSLFCNAEMAALLGHLPKIRLEHLEAFRRLPNAFTRFKIIASIQTTSDITALISAISIATRVRKDMSESQIARSLEQSISANLKRGSGSKPLRHRRSERLEYIVGDWLEKIVGAAKFKPAPWKGTNAIRPLLSGQDMRRCARHFENCLEDHIIYAATGIAGYFEHIAKPAAVVQVQQIGHLGWAITNVRGPQNKEISNRDLHQIEREFLSAGFMPRMDADDYFCRRHLAIPF